MIEITRKEEITNVTTEGGAPKRFKLRGEFYDVGGIFLQNGSKTHFAAHVPGIQGSQVEFHRKGTEWQIGPDTGWGHE